MLTPQYAIALILLPDSERALPLFRVIVSAALAFKNFEGLVCQLWRGMLTSLRNARGLSQEASAFEANLDRTFISMLERGQRLPQISKQRRWSLEKVAICVRSRIWWDRLCSVNTRRTARPSSGRAVRARQAEGRQRGCKRATVRARRVRSVRGTERLASLASAPMMAWSLGSSGVAGTG